MREKFVDHRFSAASLKAIQTINDILAEYAAQGYRLSLRQLYYQLVARGLIENSVRSYKRTGGLVSDARLAGLVDWDMIEDRGRETAVNSHWNSPAEIIRTAAKAFRVDRWEGQPCYVEVFVEKDALSGILEPVCRGLDVRFTANRGYSSSSAMYEAGKRIAGAVEAGLPSRCCAEVHLFYLGDHDPSGIDMTRDVTERLNLFTGGSVTRRTVQRLALNYRVGLRRPGRAVAATREPGERDRQPVSGLRGSVRRVVLGTGCGRACHIGRSGQPGSAELD